MKIGKLRRKLTNKDFLTRLLVRLNDRCLVLFDPDWFKSGHSESKEFKKVVRRRKFIRSLLDENN